MSLPTPAAPTHLIRSHSSDVTALFFSDDNERLYSGDASGRVVVTSTRSLRAIVSWLAHTDSILGVQEWGSRIVTSVALLSCRSL
jgi:WD40 repeat protein